MQGIVHGVMPAIGAAAVYHRAKSGTRNSASFKFSWEGFKAWTAGTVGSMVLGSNAAEMTAVLSGAPGPMQLLPPPEYGNGWLHIKADGQDIQLPKSGDPYGEIYTVRGKWWCLCDEQLMDPLNGAPVGSPMYKTTMESDWSKYTQMILRSVKPFHQAIADKYHGNTYAFYANGKDHLAYGNVTWQERKLWGQGGSGGAPNDPMDDQDVFPNQVGTSRNVAAPLPGGEWQEGSQLVFTISDPEAPGDGTVPERSGETPRPYARSVLTVSTEHEGAFRDCEAGRLFTLRAVVKIAQAVKATSLAYD